MEERPIFSPGLQILAYFVIVFMMGTLSDFVFSMFLPLMLEPAIGFDQIDFAEPGIVLLRLFFYSTFSFVLSTFIFLRLTGQSFASVIKIRPPRLKFILLCVALAAGSIVIMEVLSQYNAQLKGVMPDNTLIQDEIDSYADQIRLLDHDSPGRFIITLIILAVIPAIGEELAFRGVLQGKLVEATGNRHFAVIITSLIFAALHLRPLQLLPMIFMSVVMGYVYLKFRNISYPIIIHFLNNATMITAIYFWPELA